MSTDLSDIANCSKAVRDWWEGLDDQERIIAALDAVYEKATISGFPDPTQVAEEPWKWATEAYAFSLCEPPPATIGRGT